MLSWLKDHSTLSLCYSNKIICLFCMYNKNTETFFLFLKFIYYVWTFKKHIPLDIPLFSKNLL